MNEDEEMTKQELFRKNVTLGEEFTRYVLEHPEFGEQLPKGAHIIFLPKYDPELCEENRRIAQLRLREEEAMVYVEIERLLPQKSRLMNPRIRVAA